jgi:hypothetical protein
MHNVIVAALLLSLLASSPTPASSQTPGKIDLETITEEANRLIGSPVLDAEGKKIGHIVDLSVTDDAQLAAIRVATGRTLGLGERIVEIPNSGFMISEGAITLAITADSLDALPDVTWEGDLRQQGVSER